MNSSRALRLDIAGELEAIHGYMAHADATDNALAKAVLTDIANEERVHAGELIRLLGILTDGEEDGFLRQGTLEVDTLAAKLAARHRQQRQLRTNRPLDHSGQQEA